jgi:uncharacterized protein YlxW (UPF0749 family)
MNYDVFFAGFAIALIAVMVILVIRLWVKATLRSWGYDLVRETHTLLRDTNLKLDSIQYQQERLLTGLERLERTAARTQTSTLDELQSRLSKLEPAV